MFCSHYENSDKIFPTSEDWVLWAQYAVGMTCMKQYSKRYQSDQVVLKLELWWIKVCLEQSNAPLIIDGREYLGSCWRLWYRSYETLIQSFGEEGNSSIHKRFIRRKI